MEKFDFVKPNYLLCFKASKVGTYEDKRVWIYAVNALSLIEVIAAEDILDFHFYTDFHHFTFTIPNGSTTSYILVFIQNNCQVTNCDSTVILQNAWLTFKSHLVEKHSR